MSTELRSSKSAQEAHIVLLRCTCFHWKELAALFKELFPHVNSEQISYEIRNHSANIRLCIAGGELIGFFIYLPAQNPDVAWLDFIGVRGGYRKRGIGQLLLDKLEEVVSGEGFSRIELAVKKDNLGALRLYEKCGYSHLRTDKENLTYSKEVRPTGMALSHDRKDPRGLSAALRRTYWRAVYWLFVQARRSHRSRKANAPSP